MKKHLLNAILMTVATTVLLGILYPLLVTGLAYLFFPVQANGELISRNGVVAGSRLIGQPFIGPGYFHSRPSAAGAAGYDASASSGSNLGPTNAQLISRVNGDVARLQAEDPGVPVPVDLVTTSASGLDPHITPAGAISRFAGWRRSGKLPKLQSRNWFPTTLKTGNGDSSANRASMCWN